MTSEHRPHVPISVIIPHYQDQHGLDLLLAALELQTVGGFEVVVADDGSARPPVVGERPFPTTVVRQEDEGFRAAAARNLGARAAHGGTLAFLDGDMVPEPGYLSAIREALAEAPDDTLVVGRRRHADLGGWTADEVRAWLLGDGPAPRALDDPQWLADGYRTTEDLRHADDRSYRFVISAVMAVGRRRFEELGGFVEFSGYGGEDWEFAHRWRHHGGTLRHASAAVAWQDGSDFSRRHDADERRRIKDDETLRLAPLLPVPGARDPRLVWRVPSVAVLADVTGLTVAQSLEFLASLLDGGDTAVWVTGLPQAAHAHLEDPRIHRADEGDPERSTWVVRVHRPGTLVGAGVADVVARASRGGACPAAGGHPSSTMTVRHVPTGVARHITLGPDEWAALPGAATTLEEHWSRGL